MNHKRVTKELDIQIRPAYAGVRYLFGSEAEYLKENSIERRNGQVFFTTVRSKTNMVLAQLGVTLKF